MLQLSCFSRGQFVGVVHSISKDPRKIEPQMPMAVTYSFAISFLPYPILLPHSLMVLPMTFFPSNKERQRWDKKKNNLYPNPCLRVCFGGNKTETSLHCEEGCFYLIYLHIWLPTRLNSIRSWNIYWANEWATQKCLCKLPHFLSYK